MMSTLIDSNVLIDVLGPADLPVRHWSLSRLKQCLGDGPVVLSAIVWAELAVSPEHAARMNRALSWLHPIREDFPFSAGQAAGWAHRQYRERGGNRERTLPDFLIGAHASAGGYRLLTRDAARYRTYFPSLDIISPETHP